MAGPATNLKPKQEEAIAALLSQRSVEDAARAVGVGTRTLMRWLKQPEFDAAYRQARRDAFAQAIGPSAAGIGDGSECVGENHD